MQGEFSARIEELQAQLTELRAYVEAAIDFPDEEVEFLSSAAIDARLDRVFGGFDSIIAAARQGSLLREGLTVVIAGPAERRKVEPAQPVGRRRGRHRRGAPGTTRDLLRQRLELDGCRCT